MKRRTAWLAAIVSAMLAGVAAAQTDNATFFRIGTGSTGGTYFPIGGLIATGISSPPGSRACEAGGSCGVPGLIAVAQSTQGSVDNIEGIVAGTLESGLAQADIAFWAYEGEGPFAKRGPVEDLRAIANLYPESMHIVVRRDAGIDTVADLRGKRVGLGLEDSGTLVDARIVLEAYGLGEASIESHLVGPAEGADMLRAGELDAFFFVAGAPATAIRDLAEHMAIDLLPIEGVEAVAIAKEYPFFAAGEIDEGVYPGMGRVPTLDVGAQWLTTAGADEELIYGMTRALWHSSTQRLLVRGHPEGRNITLATALDGIAIPLHPGARRYYREAGVLPEQAEEAPPAQ